MLAGLPIPVPGCQHRNNNPPSISLALYKSLEQQVNQLPIIMSCEACRTIPPVTAKGYIPKGQFETIAGLNTCKLTTFTYVVEFLVKANENTPQMSLEKRMHRLGS